MAKLKITYIVDKEEWTDKEYQNQLSRTIFLTQSQLQHVLELYGDVRHGEEVELEKVELIYDETKI